MNRIIFALTCLVVLAPIEGVAQDRCAVLTKQGTQETLTNRCNTCREIKLQRDRPGDSFPTNRTIMLQPGLSQPLPFRGTGRTKILSDAICGGAPSALDDKTCIAIVPESKIGPVLVNSCDDCRQATLEVRERNGHRSSRPFTLAGRAYVPLKDVNALDLRITAQSACK